MSDPGGGADPATAARPWDVFISYAHEDRPIENLGNDWASEKGLIEPDPLANAAQLIHHGIE